MSEKDFDWRLQYCWLNLLFLRRIDNGEKIVRSAGKNA